MYSITNLGPVASASIVAELYRLRAGGWSVRNDQSAPGKTYPVRISPSGGQVRLPLPTGHTAALALRVDSIGTVYGWSMGRVGGRARYHAVVWAPGTLTPRIVDASDAEAIGPADWVEDGVLVHRKTANGQQGSLAVVMPDGATYPMTGSGEVPGAVAVEGGAVGARMSPSGLQPVCWDGYTLRILDGLGAVATCKRGRIVFGYRTVETSMFAVLWDLDNGAVMVDIPSPAGLTLRQVLGVFDDGSIEGVANDASGALVAWRGVPG